MKILEHEGALPLVRAGRFGEEFSRHELEQARKEFFSAEDIPIREQVNSRPYVYVVGSDEIRVTVPGCPVVRRVAPPKGKRSDEKRADNIGRAMRTVYDIIKCNKWDYFCTQTINANLLDRSDLHGFVSKMSRGVADQNKRVIHRDTKIRYLWVPELHSDGMSWHLHGVLSGLVPKDLRRNKNGYLEWCWSSDNVGFFSLSQIRSKERTASYVRKYITKNVNAGGHLVDSHLYFCSKGLERPVMLGENNTLNSVDMINCARKNARFKQSGKWADVYTLQGRGAEIFMETWGEILEVVRE